MKTISGIITSLSLTIIMAVASAQPAAAATPSAGEPVRVNAEDLISKVYGLVSPDMTPGEMMDSVNEALDIKPQSEDGNLWLDSTDGFELSYAEMTPEVMAVACFERDSLTNYAYFFIFPYDGSSRDCVNAAQADFCGALLQELYDMGLQMGSDVNAADEDDTLFCACCSRGLSLVDITLREQLSDVGGRFVVTLNVAPKGMADENVVWACN